MNEQISDDKEMEEMVNTDPREDGPRYPNVHVKLVGQDGNAFFILARVHGAMRRAGVVKEERDLFNKEATSGDYDHLLQICMKWVDCD